MSYYVLLFRKEVQEQEEDLEFLAHEKSILPFTKEQFKHLKKRILRKNYQIEAESEEIIQFSFRGHLSDIRVSLQRNLLSFQSDYFSKDSIFEIIRTCSEFTDTGEFAKLDLEVGGWG